MDLTVLDDSPEVVNAFKEVAYLLQILMNVKVLLFLIIEHAQMKLTGFVTSAFLDLSRNDVKQGRNNCSMAFTNIGMQCMQTW